VFLTNTSVVTDDLYLMSVNAGDHNVIMGVVQACV